MERKTKLLHAHFSSQRSKDWFDGPGAPARHGMSRARASQNARPIVQSFYQRTSAPIFSEVLAWQEPMCF